jgi:hypothetical protein
LKFMNNISIFQKSFLSIILCLFSFTIIINAQNPTCASFTYKGTGVLNATTGCQTALNIAAADISLSVVAPCTIVAPPSFSIAKSTKGQFYSNGAQVKVDTTLNVTYLATVNDGTANKTVTLVFQITVKETTPPTINNIPPSVTISCNPTPVVGVMATDNCDAAPALSMVISGIANACTSPGVLIRTWTATDKSGNTSTATQSITIIKDTTAPVLVTNADSDEVDCGSWSSQLTTWLDNRGNSAATDDCGVPEVIYLLKGVEKTQGDIIDSFADSLALNKCIKGSPSNILAAITIGFAYKDGCGNTSATTLATFKAKDQTPPQIDTPAKDISIECDTANIIANLTRWYNNFGGAQIIDDCSKVTNAADLTLMQVKDALALSQSTSCGNTGKVTVMFYAKDACDNASAFTNATFNVSDKRKPLFSKRPTAKTYECSTSLTDSLGVFIGNRAGATAADGCSGISWSYFWKEKNGTTGQASDLPTIKAGCNWYVDVSFVIKDECNNADTAKVRFTIQDTKAPVFANLPSDISVACSAIPTVPANITASDACSNTATVTYKGETGSSAGCAGTYILTRTWEAADSCGNKLLGVQKIQVTDNVAPTIANVPASVTVDCKAIPSVPADVSASDDCDLTPTLTFTTSSTQGTDQKVCAFYNYTITRTWKAIDKCGNETIATQQVVVKDTKAPKFVVPDDITVECYEGEDLDIVGRPTSPEDDCSTYFTTDYVDVNTNGNGTCASTGIITRTWTVTDGCLASTKTQTIQLRDSQAPLFYGVPPNVTLNCGSPLPSTANLSIADICSVGVTPTLQYNEQKITSASCSSNYQIKRTWTATDACGNTSTSSELVTYIDQQAPTILYCPSDVTANVVDGDCFAILNLLAPIVEDDCNPMLSNFTETISKNITSTVPGSATTAVNDIDFNFSASLTYQQSISNVLALSAKMEL